ncbi:MAG TPA: PEGA domain-containing protein [Methylomirabilota bacterium]|nr:PEGA domain-containing protein [Methylomirabilota bacterium]
MCKTDFKLVGLAVLVGMLLAPSAKAQAPTAGANTGSPPATAKVIFYYNMPINGQGCLDQVGIQIDNVTQHEIAKFHVWRTDVAPGLHVFSDDSHRDKGLTATLAAGQTYYFGIRWWKGFGFPTCGNMYTKFDVLKPKDIAKADGLIGKPGVDETAVAQAPQVAANTNVKLSIDSTPGAADIEVDGNFMGNTPSAIELPPGQHTIIVTKNGYQSWQRKIMLAPGEIRLSAELEQDPPK